MLGALLGVHPYLVWTRPLLDSTNVQTAGKPSRSPHDRRPHRRHQPKPCARSAKTTGKTATTTPSGQWPKPAPPAKPYGNHSASSSHSPASTPHPPKKCRTRQAPRSKPQARPSDDAKHVRAIVDYLTEGQRKKLYALRTKLVKAGVFTEDVFTESVGKEYEAEISGLTQAAKHPSSSTDWKRSNVASSE